ncbi:MAG: carboxypeptidase regulatory-like domain-containing protein [Candidatus Binataceae bacterium]
MKRLATVSMVCAALAFAVSAFAQGGAGTISGTVKLEGAAPTPKKIEITKDKEVCGLKSHFEQDLVVGSGGGIQYAVVSLTGIKAASKPQEVTFDQKGCQYDPHVLAFPAGSTVKILNSDGILHNIHTYSTKNPSFNMAQPKFKKVITVTEAQPELIKVTCDAHGWMSGWWYVTDNPYYAVTDENGNFTIKDVPPGDYTIQVWQEKLAPAGKELTQKVSVKAGAAATANFSLK